MPTQPLVTTQEKCSTGFAGPIFAYLLAWTNLANGDDGQIVPADYIIYLDRTFQIEGTFGAGGSVVIEGSNDGVNFHTMSDPQGVPVMLTSPGIKQIVEVVKYMRPHVIGGDGTTLIAVTCFARRTSVVEPQ